MHRRGSKDKTHEGIFRNYVDIRNLNIILVRHREGWSKNLEEKISSHKDMGMNMKLKLKKE